MARASSSPRRLWARLRSESGIAVPTVLAMILVGLGLAAAASVAAIGAQSGSVRDLDSKGGIAAADAAALRAIQRQNTLETTTALPCVVAGDPPSGTLELAGPEADGWCAEQTGSIGDVDYAYRVSAPEQGSGDVRIVASGSADGVTRRVAMTMSRESGAGLLAEASVTGLDGVGLNSNAQVFGNVASNGDVVLDSNAKLCGNAQYGTGQQLIVQGNAQQCPGYSSGPGHVELPPVEQGDVPPPANNNSNWRMFSHDVKQGNVVWNASTRTLALNSNSALTLGGTDYSFCQLILNSNSTLYIHQNAKVRIFFDSPERCSGQTQPFIMNSNTKIQNTSGDPTSAAFLFAGSPSIETSVVLNSNSHTEMDVILYGPYTDVTLNSNATLRGAIAAQSVTVNSNARIIADDRVDEFELPVATSGFEAGEYVECTGVASGAAADSGC